MGILVSVEHATRIVIRRPPSTVPAIFTTETQRTRRGKAKGEKGGITGSLTTLYDNQSQMRKQKRNTESSASLLTHRPTPPAATEAPVGGPGREKTTLEIGYPPYGFVNRGR